VSEYTLLGKIVESLGITGLMLFVIWKLVDKWAGKFLEVQGQQAKGMGDLAAAVREATGDQRELLLAVRVLATKVDEQKAWIKELDEHLRSRPS